MQIEDTKNELNEAILNNAPSYIVKECQKNLISDEYVLRSYEEETSLLREPNEQDIEYRLNQGDQFPKKLANLLLHDNMLCFHGTTIFGAKNILLSNTISSGADRFGRSTSFDGPGEISVTNKDTVETSVGIYMRLNGNYCYPAGCLFVIKAKDKDEYDKMPSKWKRNVEKKYSTYEANTRGESNNIFFAEEAKILNYLEFQVISNLVKYADSGIKDYKELCQKSMKIYENIINHKSKGKRKQTMYVLNKNKGKAY